MFFFSLLYLMNLKITVSLEKNSNGNNNEGSYYLG